MQAQAPIYVTPEAFQTANTIKDLDHYDRVNLCEDEPGFKNLPGYHLKNANKIKLAVLPEGACIVSLADLPGSSVSVSMPSNLRGCIFEGAPDLPTSYAAIVGYWSGESINTSSSGAAYFQCPLNEYMVDLGPDPVFAPVVHDRLLSEGVVAAINGLSNVVIGMPKSWYVEVCVPIDTVMLENDLGVFCSANSYSNVGADRIERIYLKVEDILTSPDPDRIYIDLLYNEMIDYGYFY